jgi:integrase
MTQDNIGYIWQKMLEAGNARQNSNNVKSLRKAKADFVDLLPPALRNCEPGVCLSRESLNTILKDFPENMALDSYIRLVSSVAKCLGKGKKELGWDVAIPPIPVKISREPARFTPQLFAGMATLRLLEQAVLQTPRSTSHEIELGRLLLSVIIFGGIVNAKWIELWINAFNKIAFDKDLIMWNGDCLWFETFSLEQSGRKKNDGSDGKKKRGSGDEEIILHRRWFADPVSSLLICKWRSDPGNDKKTIPKELFWFKYVKKFMKEAGLDPASVGSVTQLLQMAETALSLKVPPFLAAFATRDITSVSLPEPVWARISSGLPVKNVTQKNTVSSDDDQNNREKKPGFNKLVRGSEEMIVPSQQQGLLRKIRRSFYKNGHALTSRTEIRRAIEVIIDSEPMSPIVRLLAKWAVRLLVPTGNKPSSVRRYLGAIGGHLAALCCLDEFLDLEPGEYQEIYEQIIEQIDSDKERSYALGVLGGFHSFLVKDFGFPNIDRQYFSHSKGPAECSVDANLITCAEFDRVKAALGIEDPHRSHMATAALLIAIIGFRCGLRRNEILYLRTSDLYGKDTVELVLKPTTLRGLKSHRSKRKLLLNTLLQPDEFIMLMSWWDNKLDYGYRALLFAPIHRQDRPYTHEEVFTPITKALHMVTGDETLKFRHLRHSFATWMLLRLTGSNKGLLGRAKFLDHPEFDDSRITELRTALLDNESLGRKGAYAISALCGHSNPGTTFGSYIHLCDWLLGQELQRSSSLPVVEAATIAALSGILLATVYRNTSKTEGVDWLQLTSIASKRAKLTTFDVSDRVYYHAGEVIEYSDSATLEYKWVTVMRALKYIQVENKNLLEVAELTREGVATLERWISEAMRIANLKTRDEGEGFRHRIPARNLERINIYDKNREVWRIREGVPVKIYWRKPKRTKEHPKQPSRVYLNKWKKSVSQATCPERFPYAPRTNRDLDFLNRIMTTFEKLSGEEQLSVINFTEYFCQNFSLNGGGIWYQEPEQAIVHLDVLNKLGITKNRIALVDLETFGEDAISIRMRRTHWEEQLGLTGAAWVIAESRKSFKRISCGVGIKVLEAAGGKSKASYAARYAMYLIRITYGYKLQTLNMRLG